MLKQLLLFLLLTLSLCSYAQIESLELNEKRKRELKNLGKEAERSGKYYLALEYYKKLVELDTSNSNDQIHLADLLRYTRDYKQAEIHYQTICNIDVKEHKYPEALFYLATMQKANGKHKEAMANLEKFKKLVKSVEDKKFKKLSESELQGCRLAIAYKDSTSRVSMVSLGNEVNNPHIDFSPIPLTDDKIVFGSLRETEQKFYKISDEDTVKLPTRKFYVAEKEKGAWEFQGEWAGPFNSADEDVANGTFSLDQKRFYFTKCSQNWQFKVICKIYYSEKDGDGWSTPQLLDEEINMPGYTSSHPTMGRESKKKQEVMYFVSDREGGKGGFDIWFTEYDAKKKAFKKPKNAGSAINTEGTEITPYYDIKTKSLYYSTDGKPNIGMLDLYKTQGETNKWSNPVNLGISFNSYADDVDFALKPSGKGGFIASNREGGQSIYNATCCDDIYEFTYFNYVEVIVKGGITDKEKKECVEGGSEVNVFIVDNDNERFLTETIPVNGCKYELKLKPGFNYEIEVKKEGFFNAVTKISTKTVAKSDSVKQDVVIEKIPEAPIIIPKINYDFDSDKLTQDSKNTLDTTLVKILNDNPTFEIEIRSHTDNKGADAYNLKLSQKRAESVVRYLIEKGIDKSRLKAQGYGETLPIVPNTNPDGTDNPENRHRNRRTEFKIIGNIDPDLIQYDESDVETKKEKKGKEVKKAEE